MLSRRAWAAMRREVLSKPAHGQRDLIVAMARIEAEEDARITARQAFVGDFCEELEEAFTHASRDREAADPEPTTSAAPRPDAVPTGDRAVDGTPPRRSRSARTHPAAAR